jgi:hypothetical protein
MGDDAPMNRGRKTDSGNNNHGNKINIDPT